MGRAYAIQDQIRILAGGPNGNSGTKRMQVDVAHRVHLVGTTDQISFAAHDLVLDGLHGILGSTDA
jgi:hypothetical protein